MLTRRRCPHTGVVNFYFDAEPHMAVGSVVPGDDRHFTWRFYAEPFADAGMSGDLGSAERHVIEIGRRAERKAGAAACSAA
jgi:hypothetical protein